MTTETQVLFLICANLRNLRIRCVTSAIQLKTTARAKALSNEIVHKSDSGHKTTADSACLFNFHHVTVVACPQQTHQRVWEAEKFLSYNFSILPALPDYILTHLWSVF
jgi:hypothetical protein